MPGCRRDSGLRIPFGPGKWIRNAANWQARQDRGLVSGRGSYRGTGAGSRRRTAPSELGLLPTGTGDFGPGGMGLRRVPSPRAKRCCCASRRPGSAIATSISGTGISIWAGSGRSRLNHAACICRSRWDTKSPARSQRSGRRPQASMFKAVLDGTDLAGVLLYGAQFLNCAQLVATRNWQSAFRDDALACGAAIPAPKPEG
jgi:hypothetical protein